MVKLHAAIETWREHVTFIEEDRQDEAAEAMQSEVTRLLDEAGVDWQWDRRPQRVGIGCISQWATPEEALAFVAAFSAASDVIRKQFAPCE